MHEADQARAASDQSRAAAQGETYRAMLSEVVALRAGHRLGWREEALSNLARLVVMPTPRRDLVELRSEAVASIGEFAVTEVARLDAPGGTAARLDFSPDSRTLATSSRNADLNVWDITGPKNVARLKGVTAAHYAGQVLFLPSGELAYLTAAGGVGFLTSAGQPSARAPLARPGVKAERLGIDRQGKSLVVGWSDGRNDIVDGSTNALQPSPGPWLPLYLAPAPNGRPLRPVSAEGQGPSVTPGQYSANQAEPAFSPDGATVAGIVGRTLVLWDRASARELMRLGGHKEAITGIAFSPDGELVATTCGDSMTRIWDARDGRALAVLPGPWYMRSLTFSPDGTYLAAAADPGPVCLYQIKGRREQRRLVGHQYGSLSVAFHPTLPRAVSSSDDHHLIVWDTNRARALLSWDGKHGERGLTFSPDGSLIACSTGDYPGEIPFAVRLYDAETGAQRQLLQGHQTKAFAIAFDPSGRRLASGDDGGTVLLWDIANGNILRREKTGSAPITTVAFVDDGGQLLAGAEGGDVVLYDLDHATPPRRARLPQGCNRLAVDRATNRAIVGDDAGSLFALSLPDLTIVRRLEKAHDATIQSLAVSPDGRLLVTSGRDRRVVLRDAATFTPLLTFPAWTGVARDCAFDPSGRLLALSGMDSDVALWDLGMVRDELSPLGLAWQE